ncbi:MAG: ABC transporter substrate-binding protein [Chloroflexi bacterium]|nr:ABC transporter substrate-binding protein [Chloroflexota bacterium]
MKKFLLATAVALFLMAALLMTACGGDDKDKLTVILDWFPNADHAGLYAAEAQGYFKEEGLKVKLQAPGNPEDPPKFVAANRADIAISYEPAVILARAEGLPITAIGSIVPTPLNSIQVLRSSGIASPAQLGGKKIGFTGIPTEEVYLKAVLSKAGVNPSSVTMINVGFELSKALISKQVDAIIGGYWNVEAVLAEMEGHPVNVFKLQDWGVPEFNELVFVVNEKRARGADENLRKFLRAVAKGHAYAVQNPDAAINAVVKASQESDRELVTRGVRLLVPLWRSAPQPFGLMDEAKWRSFIQFLVDNKIVEKPVAIDGTMTNKFLQ